VRAVAVDLDAVLGDTRPLWRDWVQDASRRLRLELELPDDRAAAAATLDARAGNWRTLLEWFAQERAPVHLRPRGETNAVLRRLRADGVRVGAFSDAPLELARVALSQLGAARSVEIVGSFEEVRRELGADAVVVRSRDELAGLR
jgi:phosphoglycolate phosphatase-like HAD superfamily hydrolase